MVTWELQKGHWYGHCNNHGTYRKCPKKTYIREEKVEEQLIGFFETIAPKNNEVLEVIEEIVRQENAQNIIERETEINRLSGLLAAIRKQKDKYFEAKINEKAPLEFCERKIAECVGGNEFLPALASRRRRISYFALRNTPQKNLTENL